MLESERIITLEEQCYFHEQAIKTLNEALTTQHQTITALEKRLRLTEEKLEALHYVLQENGLQTLPPHSMPERY